jgi:chromosome segregation ATPase
LQSLEHDLDFARSAVEAESEDREVNHDLSKECLRLGMEKKEIQEQLEKALKKVEKKKGVEEEIGKVREEKQRLEEEIRKIHKEKADDKEQHLRFIEEKIKI